MAIAATNFAGQNWLITPAALAINEPRPASIADQKWLVNLNGVVIIDLKGNNAHDWRRESVTIFPDIDAAMKFAIAQHAIPVPAGTKPRPVLDLEQWAPFAAVSSQLDRSTQTFDAGFAVDVWRPAPFFSSGTLGGGSASKIFTGIVVDVAVRNDHAILHRLSYSITLLGKIRFVESI